jgi:PAS domain S-box-containing protein
MLVPIGYKDEIPQILEKIKKGEYVNHYESMRQRKDGQLISVAITISPVTDAEGKIVSASIIARDITDRKRMEDALRERERQISLIYDTVGDVIYDLKVEKEGNYIFTSVNRCFLTITGLQANQIIGKRVQYVIPEPSLTLVLEKYAEAIREKKIVRWEETTEYPTGRVTGEVSIAPVFDDKGHCTQLVGTVHDITERKRMEEALKESQTLYYSFIEQLPNAVFRKDREGRYVLVNSQFCKLKGLKKEDFIGRKPNEERDSSTGRTKPCYKICKFRRGCA